MENKKYDGFFIAVDGPNGVGKSTIVSCITEKLKSYGYDILKTKEPTNTALGNFTRNMSESLIGYPLACIIASDRYNHLKETILPALNAGKIVICDRYILSSLILQRIDNVKNDFILDIHKEAIFPDLQVAVIADEETIKKRLAKREKLTRFEHYTEEELKHMILGIETLEKYNVPIIQLNNNNNNNIDIVVNELVDSIISLLNKK